MTQLVKILWLAPNMNHYKSRFLNHLAFDSSIELSVISGAGRANFGDKELKGNWNFEQIAIDVSKNDFGKSKLVREKLKNIISQFDWVMIPSEKKNILLFLYLLLLRQKNSSIRFFSYNHPVIKSVNGRNTHIDIFITKLYFKWLDRVVFYTKHSYDWAIKNGLIDKDKAYWANNTVDTIEIKKYYNFELPPNNPPNLLFIGRLITSKRLPDLIKYYSKLKSYVPNLRLDIIGDGPENYLVRSAKEVHKDIHWHGTIVDEAEITPIMKKASIVFVPGHSGLSINHSFAYGRPYVTLKGPSHAPELSYINSGENGYILNGDFQSNIEIIKELLTNQKKLEKFCNQANSKGEYLSLQNWTKQMKRSLFDGQH